MIKPAFLRIANFLKGRFVYVKIDSEHTNKKQNAQKTGITTHILLMKCYKVTMIIIIGVQCYWNGYISWTDEMSYIAN